MTISEQILELFTKLDALNDKIELINGTLQFSIEQFLVVTGIVISILAVSLAYFVKERVESGIEKGIKETKDLYEAKFSNIENELEKHDTRLNNIIESGTNQNGTYIRFANGVMICSQKIILKSIIDGSLTEKVVFPATFYGDIVINMSLAEEMKSFNKEHEVKFLTYSDLNNFSARILLNDNIRPFIESEAAEVSIITIGKWK